MLLETASQPLARALSVGVVSDFFDFPPPDGSPAATTSEPGAGVDPGISGIYAAGWGGDRSPNRLFLMPFGAGQQGQSFWLRVYCWRSLQGAATPTMSGGTVWIPSLLAEFACSLSNQTGPAPLGPSGALLSGTEHLCDAITLTRGALGLGGYVVNTLPDMPAYAYLDLGGCQKFQFDFQNVDEQQVQANCLFARA